MKAKIENNVFPQLIAALGVLLLLAENGIIDGWASPNVARMTQGNYTISLTLPEASWLVSYHKMGKFLSVIPLPILIDWAGTKKAVLCAFIPFAVSWILMMLAKSATCLYVAEFLTGVTSGLSFGCFPIYISEISTPALRGTFIALAVFGYPVGSLVATAAETYLSEVVSCTVYLVPCLLGIPLFVWMPESPYHLVKCKLSVKARESLEWYRGQDDTEKEMREIAEYFESTNTESIAEKLKQLRLSPVQKATFLVTLAYACPQVCGVFNVIYFMQVILTNAKCHFIEPSEVVLYMNVVLVVTALISVNIIDKLGRRILLMVSITLMIMGYIGLGLHYYLLNITKVNPLDLQSLPIISIVLVIIPFRTAFAPASTSLLGEMFPASIKSIAVIIVIFVSSLGGFISAVAYEPLIEAIGEIYVFWMYAVLMVSLLPIFFFFLPETKGKSLQEIQNQLNNGNFSVTWNS